jgi:hypothetical protein
MILGVDAIAAGNDVGLAEGLDAVADARRAAPRKVTPTPTPSMTTSPSAIVITDRGCAIKY